MPLVLLVGLRSAWALYTCRIDGVVRSACCCGKAHAPAPGPGPSDTRIRAASCCAISVHAPTKPPEAQAPPRADDHAAPAVIAIAPAPVLAPPIVIVARADRRSARPPPLASFVLKQAFLR